MTLAEHSAAASAAGYLYQVRWALLHLLREGRTRPDQVLTLEMHDDISWEDERGTATDLLQTKLHAKSSAGMGDKDTDIWKTLLIWLKRDDATDPYGPELALVTTSTAQPGTAAYALRPELPDRDVVMAVEALTQAATSSTAEATAKGRTLFLQLTTAQRTTFLHRVRVLDMALKLEDLDAAVRQELTWDLPGGDQAENRYIAEVWRWWDSVSIDMLRNRRYGIAVSQLKTFMQELRDQYGRDSLRTTILLEDVEETDVELHTAGRFVDQMLAVHYSRGNLRLAVVDYYRAITQETQWFDDGLVGLHELRTFEDNLRDEWERAFNDMIDDLSGGTGLYEPTTVSNESKRQAGKALLRELLASTRITIRKHYDDPFFARGKRHELAHRAADIGIGWHPDFVDRLEELVSERVGESATS